MPGVEQTEEFAVAYVANIHESWLSHGMLELGVCSSRLFTMDASGQRGLTQWRGIHGMERVVT